MKLRWVIESTLDGKGDFGGGWKINLKGIEKISLPILSNVILINFGILSFDHKHFYLTQKIPHMLLHG